MIIQASKKDCVKDDMARKKVSAEITSNGIRRHTVLNPNVLVKGHEKDYDEEYLNDTQEKEKHV